MGTVHLQEPDIDLTMASNPPGNCCTRGSLFEGTPTGKLSKLEDGKTDVYIAEATGDKAKKDCGIIYIPDVIGIWQNSKLMADNFAAEGYTTLVIDVFNGDPVSLNPPEGFDIFSWLNKGTNGDNPHTTKEVDPIIESAIKTIKGMGVKRIGAVGYCFGAKYVVRHYKNGIDVGYVALPSLKRTSLLPSPVPTPSLRPRLTRSSLPRSATSRRRSWPRRSSLTRSTCSTESSTDLRCAVM